MKLYRLNLEELPLNIKSMIENFSDGIVILQGDLAAGKTTFVKEVVKFFNIKDDVTSPTFSLQQCYGDSIYHYDLYNHGLEHFISLGMLEELEKSGLHFVEWGDTKLQNILTNAGLNVMTIKIEKTSQEMREYRVEYA